MTASESLQSLVQEPADGEAVHQQQLVLKGANEKPGNLDALHNSSGRKKKTVDQSSARRTAVCRKQTPEGSKISRAPNAKRDSTHRINVQQEMQPATDASGKGTTAHSALPRQYLRSQQLEVTQRLRLHSWTWPLQTSKERGSLTYYSVIKRH